MRKEYIGTCVENPFKDMGTLVNIMDNNAIEITSQEFLGNCYVHETVIEAIEEYPHDFDFYKSGSVYFYCHSAIEHFYALGAKAEQ